MIDTPGESLRERLYEAYASQHARCGDGEAVTLIYRRGIRPELPPPVAGPVLDISCGQGQLVRLMLADGYDATGIGVIARVRNTASPCGGQIRYGNFTHESSHTARSVRQVAAASGFVTVDVRPCPPVAHGLLSAARVAVWKSVSAWCKVALAAETGTLRGHIVTQNLTFAVRKGS